MEYTRSFQFIISLPSQSYNQAYSTMGACFRTWRTLANAGLEMVAPRIQSWSGLYCMECLTRMTAGNTSCSDLGSELICFSCFSSWLLVPVKVLRTDVVSAFFHMANTSVMLKFCHSSNFVEFINTVAHPVMTFFAFYHSLQFWFWLFHWIASALLIFSCAVLHTCGPSSI